MLMMAVIPGQMKCKVYPSAFSGEVVFQVETVDEQSFEGIAPKHYVISNTQPTKDGVDGQIKVRILKPEIEMARFMFQKSVV